MKDLRSVGQKLWFEYHCSEDHDSAHAHLWYRSHQQVEVIAINGADPSVDDESTFLDRCRDGAQITYQVLFQDGLEDDVFEDELLDSQEEFCRPDPPKGVINES